MPDLSCLGRLSAGQSTTSQSQQYNLALLHSLLAQAHSAGIPAAATSGTSVGQAQPPAQGMRPPGQPQWPNQGAARLGQPQLPVNGAAQAFQSMQQGRVSMPGPGINTAPQGTHAQASAPQHILQGQHPRPVQPSVPALRGTAQFPGQQFNGSLEPSQQQ